MPTSLPEYVDGWPNLCGSEPDVAAADATNGPYYLPESGIDFGQIRAASTIALHMQQPLIPAGGPDIHTADLISNLQYMRDNQHIGDNHNAPVFEWCYKRVAEFIPQLMNEGKNPRVMLDYSGCLLHGLRKMGSDVVDRLKTITCDPRYRRAVEWLGCTWSHAVAPSTPVQDYRRHVQAWRHHFAAMFGLDALARVRGFSPAEMALPNHPDVAYEFVKTLKDSGYLWVMVQEHTVEQPDTGRGPEKKHLPHRLVARNSAGQEVSIIAIIKTQGSDTKLVAQMQPYYEARGLDRWELAGRQVPPLVTQIGDGENGGVMMNEFPGKYLESIRESSGGPTPVVNVTEYLEYLFSCGIRERDLPTLQPIHQKRIWERLQSGGGPDQLQTVIEALRKEDHRFNMEGGSWTNNISWVRGYENVLGPMDQVSALFAQRAGRGGINTADSRYRHALFLLLVSQTSCFRYWGQGVWTDYAREICRRATVALERDFPAANGTATAASAPAPAKAKVPTPPATPPPPAVTFKGTAIQLEGRLPAVGTAAPTFCLAGQDLGRITDRELRGQRVVLNIFPSIDTPVCAASVRRFNQEAAKLNNTTVLCISADLPFAQARFCGAEGLKNVKVASVFRAPEFGRYYGVLIADGPLSGLLARAVIILDPQGVVRYTQLVPEIAKEPDYAAALAALAAMG